MIHRSQEWLARWYHALHCGEWSLPTSSALDAVMLEDRLMLSAGPLAGELVSPDAAAAQVDSPAQMAPADPLFADGTLASAAESSAGQTGAQDTTSFVERRQLDRAQQAARLELVFVDNGALDYQQLVDDLLDRADSSREVDVYLLDSTRDGVEQISAILAGYLDVDAVHLVSHGEQGKIKLGSVWHDADNLAGYAGEVAGWNGALRDGADLLIYGCKVAASEQGRTLAAALGALCNCDVAASVDDTGNALFGGDWELEFTAGPVETGVAFSMDVQQSWMGILANQTFQQGVGGYSDVRDTTLDSGNPNTGFGASASMTVTGAPLQQGLIRFDNLFGAMAGQIPLGATINSVTLTLVVSDASAPGATISLHRMLVDWNDSSTWNSLVNGVQADNVESAAAADSVLASPNALGAQSFSGATLTATVQSWANGGANRGWAVMNDSTNNWLFHSSNDAAAGLRPQLTIDYTPPTILVVDTTSDLLDGNTTSIGALLASRGADGFISFREAITAANNTVGKDNIYFNIGGGGVQTITISGVALPAITDAVIIDGRSQPGYAGAPLIELRGGTGNGLTINAGGSTVRGLVINSFTAAGIKLNSGGGNTIQGNFIGIDPTGSLDRGNGLDGVRIDNSANNVVGGIAPQSRNIISGNNIHGVRIVTAGSTDNLLQGNYIGTTAAGTAALGNAINGMWIASGASNNIVGGDSSRRWQRDLGQL